MLLQQAELNSSFSPGLWARKVPLELEILQFEICDPSVDSLAIGPICLGSPCKAAINQQSPLRVCLALVLGVIYRAQTRSLQF